MTEQLQADWAHSLVMRDVDPDWAREFVATLWEAGADSGYSTGWEDGFRCGRDDGEEAGFNEGYDRAMDEQES